MDALVKTKINNFEEFRFLFSDRAQVEAFVPKVKMGEDHLIQTARLRRAWAAMNLYFTQAEQDRSTVVTSDLDSLLDESELRDSKQAFWRRYRQRFPPEVHPSDSTISRVSREMSKRMLCIYSVWKVKTLQAPVPHQPKEEEAG